MYAYHHIWLIFVHVYIFWWYTEFRGSQLFATTPSVVNNPSNIAQWLAYASVALDISPFAGQFLQATSLTVGYGFLLVQLMQAGWVQWWDRATQLLQLCLMGNDTTVKFIYGIKKGMNDHENVSGHILTKIWLPSPTWLPRGHVRLPPSRRSPWGIDLVPGSHVIMSCQSWSKYLSPKSWETWKNLLDSNPVI